MPATAISIDRARQRRQLDTVLADYLRRYTVPGTITQVRSHITQCFAFTKKDPYTLTEDDVLQWAQHGNPANNTVRQRLSDIRTFARWAQRQGYPLPYLDLSVINRQYPKQYGKVQDKHPANRLTYEQAYNQLLPACQDGTWVGSRDQLAIRLGLLGLRAAEICSLTWSNLQGDELHWIGKGRKARTVTIPPVLATLLTKWFRHYQHEVGTVTPDMPLLCTNCTPGLVAQPDGIFRLDTTQHIVWGKPLPYRTLANRVTYRAEQAGLQHLSTHDLRRTCARILHEARSTDGGHIFDIHEIQEQLGHASIETTQACYIGPVDRDTLTKAATYLD